MLVTLLVLSGALAFQEVSGADAPPLIEVSAAAAPQVTAELTPQNVAPATRPARSQMVCETRALTGGGLNSASATHASSMTR